MRGSPGACFWRLSGTSGSRPSLFSKQPIGAQAATAAHGRAGHMPGRIGASALASL
ncbi:hypothetical protein RAA17_13305 [Komagataeibacter rhaeticus]|nr:hypothetical protein [Komagataeibacter rhaeticus]